MRGEHGDLTIRVRANGDGWDVTPTCKCGWAGDTTCVIDAGFTAALDAATEQSLAHYRWPLPITVDG